jgi:hypothetical protein
LAAGGEIRGLAHEDLARLRGRLQPLRRVHHVAHGRVVAAGPQPADQHLAGVQPDPEPNVEAQVRPGRRHRAVQLQRGAHGALGIVLVGDRGAEQGEDGIADDLVDPAAEGLDVRDQTLEAPVDQPFHLFGITSLGHRREAHEIGEQDGHDPALVPPQLELGAAARAVARAGWDVGAAGRAGHGASLGTA